jgi:hypothetical protein
MVVFVGNLTFSLSSIKLSPLHPEMTLLAKGACREGRGILWGAWDARTP